MRTILYKDSDQLIEELNKIWIERIPFRIVTDLKTQDTMPGVLLALLCGGVPFMYVKRYEFRQATDPNGFIFIEALLKAENGEK